MSTCSCRSEDSFTPGWLGNCLLFIRKTSMLQHFSLQSEVKLEHMNWFTKTFSHFSTQTFNIVSMMIQMHLIFRITLGKGQKIDLIYKIQYWRRRELGKGAKHTYLHTWPLKYPHTWLILCIQPLTNTILSVLWVIITLCPDKHCIPGI